MQNKPTISFGLTLPELVITASILGILVSMAIPGFMNVIRNNRSATIANQLVTALNYARSEAIKRGLQVTIKHKGAITRVWDQGWDIFTDNNGDGVMDKTDELLKTYEALPQGYTLRTGANFANWVAYMQTGVSRGASGFANDTFRLCDDSGNSKQSRAIIIKMGRVRTETGKVTCP